MALLPVASKLVGICLLILIVWAAIKIYSCGGGRKSVLLTCHAESKLKKGRAQFSVVHFFFHFIVFF